MTLFSADRRPAMTMTLALQHHNQDETDHDAKDTSR